MGYRKPVPLGYNEGRQRPHRLWTRHNAGLHNDSNNEAEEDQGAPRELTQDLTRDGQDLRKTGSPLVQDPHPSPTPKEIAT